LEKEFDRHNVKLCSNANIINREVNQSWIVNNCDKDYIIIYEANKLMVGDLSRTEFKCLNLYDCLTDNEKTDILVYEKACL